MWKPTPENMYLDLLKQGFMKPMRGRRAKAPKTPRPIVACHDCLNWHPQGKHTADAATRKARRAADKAAEIREMIK